MDRPCRACSWPLPARSWLAPLALAGALSAQTYIVDANNGPGTNFTSIAAAVAAVPDGSTLLVRPGSYQPFVVHQKGLSMRGDPGAVVQGSARIEFSLPAQTSVLTGFAFVQPPNATFGLTLSDCEGLVVVEGVTTPVIVMPLPGPLTAFPIAMGVFRCAQVVVRSSLVTYSSVGDSSVVIEGCTLRGNDEATIGSALTSATAAFWAFNSRIQIAGATQVRGGNVGSAGGVPGAGMQVVGSDVRLLDGVLRAGAGGIGSSAAVLVGGTLRLDPRVVVLATGSQTFFGTPIFAAMPQVTSTSAAPGGTIHASTATQVGDLVLLCVSWPGAPQSVGLPVDVWLDLGSIGTCVAGVQQPGVPVSADVAVPNTPGLSGTRLAWQALTWNAATGLSIANPSLPLVD